MSEVKINKCTPEDAVIVRAILRETWLDTYSAFIPLEDIFWYLDNHYPTYRLIKMFEDPDNFFYVAEYDKTECGLLRCMINTSEKRFYVSSLYVLPGFQGLHVGSILLKHAYELAAEKGFNEVWLGVMNKNVKSLEWYKKSGFVFPVEEPFKMGNTVVNHLIGYKTLGPQNQK